jgi:hypothetical protein
MYLAKVYEPGATAHRIRYAIANILRDRIVNEGAFRVCFEMGDEDTVMRTILRRGLRNPRLRIALERSHLIDLTHWLARYPDLAEAYLEIGSSSETQSGSASRGPAKSCRISVGALGDSVSSGIRR